MRGFVLAFCVLLVSLTDTDACSCMPTHPQVQYCQADFVILTRVKKEYTTDTQRFYKTKIRKEYKMSEKSYEALKYGRISTARDESMCGVRLKPGKLYVIAGRVVSLKAHVNLCHFVQRWDAVTKRQRKGLRMMYRHGCSCGVTMCSKFGRCRKSKDACRWTTYADRVDCQADEGMCLRSASRQCVWVKNAAQSRCMRNTTEGVYPPTISRWSEKKLWSINGKPSLPSRLSS